MWEYTDKVREYYREPRHVGEIADANAIGEVGSLTCGDALKIYLKIDANGIIEDAKFQTFGCGSAVASAGALIDMIIGKHIDDAKKITNKDIADFLGGLPAQKMHCSVLGKEALDSAFANYFGDAYVPHDHEHDDKIICSCFGVTESKIREVVDFNKITTVEDVTNYCKAGGACGRCKSDIQHILNDMLGIEEQKTVAKPLTKTQMIIKVNNILENYVASELRKDGGDIELVDIEGNTILVNLVGACKHCPSSSATLKNFVESVLKEHLGPDTVVQEA